VDLLLPSIDEIDKALAERSLAEFQRQSWRVLEPENFYHHNWHIDLCSEYLEAVDLGQINRLLINMPPRNLKSRTVTTSWPAHSWIKYPTRKWMMVSYSGDLATQHSRDRRTLIESEWYQSRWGNRFELRADLNKASHFGNDQGGEMIATSTTGRGAGFGCDRLIFDDPHNTEKAESEADRRSVIGAFRKKFSTRLNNRKTGAIVVVMQRLHAEDVAGVALEMGYTHLCIEGMSKKRRVILLPSSLNPAVRRPKIECDCSVCTDAKREKARKAKLPPPPDERPTPADGLKYLERAAGEYLIPQREGLEEHAQLKIELGSVGYAAQYDQRPNPEEGFKFKRKWFRYFKDGGDHYELTTPNGAKRVLKSDCWYFATADTAMSEKTSADPTAILTWAVTPDRDLLLLDVMCERMEDPDVEKVFRSLLSSGRVGYIACEPKANGIALIQRLVREGAHIRATVCEGDKISRATPACIDLENGKLYFLAEAPWLSSYELELIQFPNGAHDDQVDATAYAAVERARELILEMPGGGIGVVATS
jgi:predicted phage terminase large subunit-like protein